MFLRVGELMLGMTSESFLAAAPILDSVDQAASGAAAPSRLAARRCAAIDERPRRSAAWMGAEGIPGGYKDWLRDRDGRGSESVGADARLGLRRDGDARHLLGDYRSHQPFGR